MRFMIQVYGVSPYSANGNDVVRNYKQSAGGGLEVVNNGTSGRAPQPGDVISFDNPNGLGHVAVVASTSVDGAGNGSVKMISQNDTADGWRTLSVQNWRVQGFGKNTPYGWLHGGGSPPPPPPPPPAHDPVGHLDAVDRVSGGVRLRGWARDDDDSAATIQVSALIDGSPAGNATAGIFRGDVGTHGFDFSVPMDEKAHQVCTKAINIGGGSDVVLPGCVQVEQLWHDPEGHLDSAQRVDNGHVRLVGWASDADITGAIQVQALLDGAVAGQATANLSHPTVPSHGFDFVVPIDWHGRLVCAKALNAGGGGNDVVLGGCTRVAFAACAVATPTIVSADPNAHILGTPGNDVIWVTGGQAEIAGAGGDDTICGGGEQGTGPGGNEIHAGPGNSLIFTGPGNNDIVAGPGHTQVISGGGRNRIAVCPDTVVWNQGPSDQIAPGGNCGATTPSPQSNLAPETPGQPTSASTTTSTPTTVSPPTTVGPTTTTSTSTPNPPTPNTTTTTASTPAPPPPSREAEPACTSGSSPGVSLTVAGAGAGGLSVRQGPTTYHPIVYTVSDGQVLTVVCYLDSVAVEGNIRWHRLTDGYWVPDAYVKVTA